MLEHNRRDTTIGWHREPEAQGWRGASGLHVGFCVYTSAFYQSAIIQIHSS